MAGLAFTVAFIAALGAFIVASSESMALRAVAGVPIDWQVLVASGTSPESMIDAIGKAAPYRALQQVGYADTAGFSAVTGDTSQTTGPGKVLGLQPNYRERFPGPRACVTTPLKRSRKYPTMVRAFRLTNTRVCFAAFIAWNEVEQPLATR